MKRQILIIAAAFCMTASAQKNPILPELHADPEVLADGGRYYIYSTTDHGDSGGIVYTYFSNQNKRYTTGIVTGSIKVNGVIKGGFYSKASLALSTLGLERY